ncbi:hypothetical protein D9M70_465890 [compost metagenome]
MPAIGLEASGGVIGKPMLHIPVYRDAVVIVEADELAKLQGASQRAGLVGDALHQATVAQKGIGVVIDNGVLGAVEASRQGALGNGHPDRIGQPLPQGTCSRFHTWGNAIFGMPRSLGMQLAEVTQLRQRQVIAGKVQQRIKQHRTMAI